MGVGVSSWQLARAVSLRGQIGVVSGTALDLILTRRLQLGDPGGHIQRALAAFPDRGVADRIIERYYIADGKAPDQPFAAKPMASQKHNRHVEELLVAGNFVEVFLAKEGHDGIVGMNYLHKVQTTQLASLYGAMLAGVDVVVVGAGIPFDIPRIIDGLARSEPVELALNVRDARNGNAHKITFDPNDVLDHAPATLPRPRFFPIVSSATLASLLVKRCGGQIDGFIVEAPSAGGHNAPPRGRGELSPEGEPVYGPRDAINVEAIRSLGIPFWLAGSYGTPGKLRDARAAGAAGIQVGTLFAFCDESGLRDDLKRDVLDTCRNGTPRVFTDPVASPTGFPFKVIDIDGTLSDPDIYAARRRQCDLGYLREAFEREDGTLGWRCPSEEPILYIGKGGTPEDTVGRKCLCNSLLANIDLAQLRDDLTPELPLVTSGDDLSGILRLLGSDKTSYTSSDVIDFLLSLSDAPESAV
jgi:nitronate monooxygenase